MIRDRIFIIAASKAWDELYGNDMRAMAEEIALYNSVLYVNPPVKSASMPNESASHGLQLTESNNSELSHSEGKISILKPPSITLPVNEIYSDEAFDILNESVGIQYAEIIKRAAESIHAKWDSTFLITDNHQGIAQYLTRILPVRLSLFYRSEKTRTGSVPAHRSARLEQEAARIADIVITDNVKMSTELRQYNQNSFNIGRGVDLSAYHLSKTYPRPEDIADIDTKIIGCAGTISSLYLSPTLIYQLGISFPDSTIVLLGKKDPLISEHPVHTLPNIRFVGVKNEKELPAYISAFDVCIDPAVNDHPNSRYRNSLINYLALGKSVVCNDMDYIRPFRDYVLAAHSEQEFIEKVSWALHTRLPWSIRYTRAEFARTFSWSKCVERIYVIIDMTEEARTTKSWEVL